MLTDLIAERVGLDYNYLSSLFSSLESMTIERYIILQRIERVRNCLCTMNLPLVRLPGKQVILERLL